MAQSAAIVKTGAVQQVQVARKKTLSQQDIDSLTAEAKVFSDKAEKRWKSFLNNARNAGIRLLKIKAGIPHGDWSDYLKQHWQHPGPQIAQKYMKIARLWDENTKLIEARKSSNPPQSMNAVDKLLRTPRERRKEYAKWQVRILTDRQRDWNRNAKAKWNGMIPEHQCQQCLKQQFRDALAGMQLEELRVLAANWGRYLEKIETLVEKKIQSMQTKAPKRYAALTKARRCSFTDGAPCNVTTKKKSSSTP